MKSNEHKLTQVGNRTYMIKGETNIGIYLRSADEAVIIDTGYDHMGKVIDELLSDMGVRPAYILNTHSHRDHMDGNSYLMKKYDIPAYTSAYEVIFDQFPDLEPVYFYGGYPEKRLLHMFGHEEPCGIEDIAGADTDEIEYIELPGHSPGMLGFRTPDGIWFTGDAYLGLGYLARHTFGYMCRIDAFLDSLEKIKSLEGKLFIPGHGRSETDVTETIEANFRNIEHQMELVKETCERWAGLDRVVQVMGRVYELPEDTGYYAMQSANMKSMLSYLEDTGVMERRYIDGVLKWKVK